MEPQGLQALVGRANFLRNNPQEQKTGELDSLIKSIQFFSSQGRVPGRQQQSLAADDHAVTFPDSAVSASPTPVSFTPDQVNALRAQIHAFKLITRSVPVPENIQHAIRVPEKLLQGSNVVVDNAVWEAKGEPVGGEDVDLLTFMEDDVTSGIYTYNAYQHPFIHLKRPAEVDPKLFATRLQRLMIPTIVPTGLDARQIVEERDRFIDARMQQRTREFEAFLSTIGHGGFETSFDPQDIAGNHPSLPSLISSTSHGKIRALIELKSLHLLDKYRFLRAQVAETFTHGPLLPSNRPDLRHFRKPTVRDARVTEQRERKQRLDRERRVTSKHVEQLGVIRDHARQVVSAHRAARGCVVRLERLVLDFHQVAEKEEQKRVERLAKERIRALKTDDEEAYRALVDSVKDTRITHLLRQTDAYLDSLAHAVAAHEGEPTYIRFDMEQGTATEATFGAQISAEDTQETSSGKTDYYAVAHCISEKITRQPSLLVGGTLKEYQLKGLQWMVSLYNNRLNGILADEMGLGKTIQAISLITFLIDSKKQNGPYLVVVPPSTMANWSGEFAKWAPSLKLVAYKGNPAQRRALEGELRVGHFHVLLRTYEYIIKDRPILCKIKWLHMIIDEGRRIIESKLTVTLTTYYHSRYRLLLSGTPLQNNLTELWSLLNVILPRIFNSAKSFDEWFNTPFANSGTDNKIALSEEEALLIIRCLHKVLRPFLLRRLKKDVESELPDKVEKVVRVPMSALQSQIYKQMKPHKRIADGSSKNGQRLGVKGLSSELLQLRKICQHPFLFESVEDEMNPDGLVDDKLIRNSGKIELLNRILPKFFAGGHRVLIFFQMTKVMAIMADFLTMMGWKFLRLDGATKTEERANFVQLFNAEDSEYKVFILSTRAGGSGLNLQAADTVIMFDVAWNPHADLQAQDLVHRIGQTKTGLILHFITEKSVEEGLHQYKLDIDHKVIEVGPFDGKPTPEEQEKFLRSILEAKEDQDSEEASDMNDNELNSIIARNEAEAEMFRDMDTKREREVLENWRAQGHRGKPPPLLTQFEELPECYQRARTTRP